MVDELARKVREVEILRAMAEQVTSSLDLDVVLDIILSRMDESFGFAHSMILLLRPEGDALEVVKCRGYGAQELGATVKVGVGVIGLVARHRKLMRVGSLRSQRSYAAALAGQQAVSLPGLQDAQSMVAVPLLARGALIGVFAVESLAHSVYDDADRDLVETLAHFAAGAIYNAQLYRAEREQREEVAALARASGRFVPHEFLRLLGRERLTEVERGDHVEKEMSVLFSDIRSFTALVEGRTPAQNFAFINEYFSYMEPPIRAQRGFIDSFEGDALMALFANADGDNGPSSADAAVAAAVGNLRALDALGAARAARGEAPLRVGVGVNTGRLMLGTIGAQERIKCGVIGDPVNLAARVEGMTRMYGAALLITEHTLERLTDPAAWSLRRVDRVRAKGKTAAVTVYEVLDGQSAATRAARERTRPGFHAAVDVYLGGRFAEAAVAFAAVLADDPGDVAAATLLGRCHELADAPPPGWDGAHELKSK